MPFALPGGAGGVIELRRVVGGGVLADVVGGVAVEQALVEDEQLVDQRGVEAAGVRRVGDQHLRGRVGEPVADPVVAVEHRHREQDPAELPGAEEDRRGLGRGGEDHRDPVALADPVLAQHVGRLVGEVLELAPVELAGGAVVALPDHRRLVARVLVADVGGDVVALGHAPLVLGARLLVGLDRGSARRRRHRLSSCSGGLARHYPRSRPIALRRRTGGARRRRAPRSRPRRPRHVAHCSPWPWWCATAPNLAALADATRSLVTLGLRRIRDTCAPRVTSRMQGSGVHPPGVKQAALALVAAGHNDCEVARRLGISTDDDPRLAATVVRVAAACLRRRCPTLLAGDDGRCDSTARDYAELLPCTCGDGSISLGRPDSAALRHSTRAIRK